jgi:hypothetical protein
MQSPAFTSRVASWLQMLAPIAPPTRASRFVLRRRRRRLRSRRLRRRRRGRGLILLYRATGRLVTRPRWRRRWFSGCRCSRRGPGRSLLLAGSDERHANHSEE